MGTSERSRGRFLAGTLATLGAAIVPLRSPAAEAAEQTLRALARRSGGRLGMYALDTGTEWTLSYHGDQRFPTCSTFKVLLVAGVLARVDAGAESLERRVRFGPSDLLDYAPVAKAHVKDGFMTIRALCDATIRDSDNTAANVLLRTVGGPAGVTRFARSLGDAFTLMSRTEPALNSAIPGDVRDTTTPAAIARDLRAMVLGSVLMPNSRLLLTTWLVDSRTGAACLRAGLPAGWRVGDKTGLGGAHNAFGDSDTRNDVAVAWPPHRAPLIIAAYLTGSILPAKQRDATLARVARIVHAAWAAR